MTPQPSVRTMPLASLTAAPYNPRKISKQALAGLSASVKRFGLVEPLVWNERTKHLVGGHQRAKALEGLGQKNAQVVVVDLPESEERVLNVALNAPDLFGTFLTGQKAARA